MIPRETQTNLEWLRRLAVVENRDSTYKPATDPLVFSRASGSEIFDAEGRSYIDLCAGFGALALGHGSVALSRVCQDYVTGGSPPPVEHGMGDVYPSVDKVLFLEELQTSLPKAYGKGSLALSGGQAVEIAVKTAILHTKKTGFIAFHQGYHGLDLGILALTSREDFKAPFYGWLQAPQVVHLPYGASKEELDEAVKRLSQSVGFAGVILEPVQGRAGVKVPEFDWLQAVEKTTHQHGGLVIFDEVFTGFGRIGKITSGDHVDADLLCFGKAIGGGFPISACFGKTSVMDAWPESPGEALHTGTFFGHPFSARVGLETIREIKQQNLCERATRLGAEAKSFLSQELSGRVKEVRGLGLMLGLEFHRDGVGASLMDTLRPLGVIALPSGDRGQVLSITPALNIDERLFKKSLQIIVDQVIATVAPI